MPTPQPPVDTNVAIPASVARAAAAANALHAQAYSQPASPQPDPAPSPAPAPAPAPSPAPQPAPPPVLPPEPQPQPQDPPAPVAPQPQGGKAPPAEALSAEEWRRRYLSMEGRYRQAAGTNGVLQEQLQEMGDELTRTMAQQRGAGNAPAPQPQPQPMAPVAELTPEEIAGCGPELIAVMQKVARAAVAPDLQNVHSGLDRGLRQVSQRVQQVSQVNLHTYLDEQVPEWRGLNKNEAFIAWCGLPDVYSGNIRGRMLQAAFATGQAARVAAFFKGFLNEGQATGAIPDPTVPPPAQVPPRVPVVPLEMLASPGRAKPAGGDNPQGPADKPHFTRPQIAAFYRAVREGRYIGREPEKAATEAAIFAAQSDGRIH